MVSWYDDIIPYHLMPLDDQNLDPMPGIFMEKFRASHQTGKYVVRAEDLQRARKQTCAQRPIKRAEFEKYT